MANVQPEDVVIRCYVGDSFQLIDAATQEQIAIVTSTGSTDQTTAYRNRTESRP
jgi:hypothetical protein